MVITLSSSLELRSLATSGTQEVAQLVVLSGLLAFDDTKVQHSEKAITNIGAHRKEEGRTKK